MNSNASVKQQKKAWSAVWVVIALLLILAVISAFVLVAQLSGYSAKERHTFISLTEGGEGSVVEVFHGGLSGTAGGSVPGAKLGRQSLPRLASDEATKFSVKDDQTVWSTTTDVEIFSVRYDNNGDLVFTVNSENGDKLIAPGTDQTYSYTLINSESVSLDYTMTVEAYVEGTELWIPVVAKLYDDAGEYLAGSASAYVDVLELNGIVKNGSLAAGGTKAYTLVWQWPFERFDGEGLDANDEYDTMLGNLAVDEDLVLHIIIKTLAVAEDPEPTPTPTPSPKPTGKPGPKTGDESQPLVWLGLMAAAFVAAVVLIVVLRRKENQKGYADR